MKNPLSIKVLAVVLILLITIAGTGMVMASQSGSSESTDVLQTTETGTDIIDTVSESVSETVQTDALISTETVETDAPTSSETADSETDTEYASETSQLQSSESADGSETAMVTETSADKKAEESPTGIKHSPNSVPAGVYVNGIDLSHMTYEEAEKTIKNYITEKCSGVLTLTLGDEKTEIPFSDFDFEADAGNILEDIKTIGASGNLLQKYKALADAKNNKKQYEIKFDYDTDLLRDISAHEAAKYNSEMSNATLVRHSGEFIITDDVTGIEVDTLETVNAVLKAMEEDTAYDSITVPISAKESKPEHTREELEKITDLLGSYSTEYWGSTEGRIANIANGAALIDETVLYPGETFSTLAHVQPFTYENGYYEATGYSGGKVIPSIGGGICQVSTTLYNAVLRAELEVVERYNHGLTVSYVPLAADATVSEDECDFRFKNNLNDPVYIEAYTYDGSIYVNIYGKEYRAEGRSIEFDSVTDYSTDPGDDVIIEDPTLPEGYTEVTQSAHQGYVASLYKYIYNDGNLVDTQLINTSEYYPAPAYIKVGTAKSEDSESETDESESEGSDSDGSDSDDDQEDDDADDYSDQSYDEDDYSDGELEDADY